MRKIKKIATKILIVVIPVLIVVMTLQNVASSLLGKKTIGNFTNELLVSYAEKQKADINDFLDKVGYTAETEANVIANNYENMTEEGIEQTLVAVTNSDESFLGSGVWFEPDVYKNNEFFGPYAYTSGGNMVITYDYSNSEYNYFAQEYYTKSKTSSKPVFTDPYFDSTSGLVMMSCSAPMIKDGKFLGCVTVDVVLGEIQEKVSAAVVGTSGRVILLTGKGVYIGAPDAKKVTDQLNITADSNPSLASAGSKILASKEGHTTYEDDGTHNLFWTTSDILGWKVAVTLPLAETNAPIKELGNTSIILTVISTILISLAVILSIRGTTARLKRLMGFSEALAEYDFSIPELEPTSSDEVGEVTKSVNKMYSANKSVVSSIIGQAKIVDETSENLSSVSKTLAEEFKNIQDYVSSINEAMSNTAASLEEVSASAEEVDSSVAVLAGNAKESKRMADDISERATKIEKESEYSYSNAISISAEYDRGLAKSLSDAEVVASISELAEVISGIAGKINLISLNASIEAARAGELGKGFAVVAGEIGKLASDTTVAVREIQDTVAGVREAFDTLIDSAQNMLSFVNDTVTPDYKNFVSMAKQYHNDADLVDKMSKDLSLMAENISAIMSDVGQAVNSIAASTQETAENCKETHYSVASVAETVDNVADMAQIEENVSLELLEVVSKFKI